MQGDFSPYGLIHLAVLLVSFATWWGLVTWSRRVRGTPSERTMRRFVAAAILLANVGWTVYKLTPSRWNIDASLPFHLCDFAWMVAVWSILTGPDDRAIPHQAIVLWGLGLSALAYATPTVREGPATLRFWHFWVSHAEIVGVALINLLAFGVRPTWRGCGRTVLLSFGLFIPVTVFNLVAGTPYFFSGPGKPDNPTPLDLLGPWPLRVVWMVLLGVAALYLLTAILRRRSDAG